MRIRLTEDEWTFFIQQLRTVLTHSSLSKERDYIQHGDTSCLLHSVAVAYYCYFLARRLHLKCKDYSLILGALLHDYFLYDWHVPAPEHRLHGFFHPQKALINAMKDFPLTSLEQDIIAHHMFPLTVIPPHHLESMLVCLVDKYCSLNETLCRKRYYPLNNLINSLDP